MMRPKKRPSTKKTIIYWDQKNFHWMLVDGVICQEKSKLC